MLVGDRRIAAKHRQSSPTFVLSATDKNGGFAGPQVEDGSQEVDSKSRAFLATRIAEGVGAAKLHAIGTQGGTTGQKQGASAGVGGSVLRVVYGALR